MWWELVLTVLEGVVEALGCAYGLSRTDWTLRPESAGRSRIGGALLIPLGAAVALCGWAAPVSGMPALAVADWVLAALLILSGIVLIWRSL